MTVNAGWSTGKGPESAWSWGRPRLGGGWVRLDQRTMGTVLQEEAGDQATQSFAGHLEEFHLHLSKQWKAGKGF